MKALSKKLIDEIVKIKSKSGQAFSTTVSGFSMNPLLYENDLITVQAFNNYNIGDILVFFYLDKELLVHRLLEIKNEKYYCKGDNALRLEEVQKEQLVGKVIKITRNNQDIPIPICKKQLIILSLLENKKAIELGYDREKLYKTNIYKVYEKFVLRKENIYMDNVKLYQKNNEMDYIQTDETSLTIYDSESGNTYFFDEIGIDILSLLETPIDIETIIEKLCEIYNGDLLEMKSDVEEFLNDVVEKKVVLEI